MPSRKKIIVLFQGTLCATKFLRLNYQEVRNKTWPNPQSLPSSQMQTQERKFKASNCVTLSSLCFFFFFFFLFVFYHMAFPWWQQLLFKAEMRISCHLNDLSGCVNSDLLPPVESQETHIPYGSIEATV